MLKLIGLVVVFALGAGAGVWWGVYHPAQAADMVNDEQLQISKAVALAKQSQLQQDVTDLQAATTQPEAVRSLLSKYKERLEKVSLDVKDATHKAMNQ